jgi:hypothetical protein
MALAIQHAAALALRRCRLPQRGCELSCSAFERDFRREIVEVAEDRDDRCDEVVALVAQQVPRPVTGETMMTNARAGRAIAFDRLRDEQLVGLVRAGETAVFRTIVSGTTGGFTVSRRLILAEAEIRERNSRPGIQCCAGSLKLSHFPAAGENK